jgi:peptidoglycan hydrolase-like protein with peptidoglycan-binding domain
MKRTGLAILFFLAASAGVLRADQTTAEVQRALKDQGFYYGEVSGEKSADTTAAIRRYQIRNGLQITGEIDAETLHSLGVGAGARATPQAEATPAPNDNEAGQSAEIPDENAPGSAAPNPGAPRYDARGIFGGTPYEIAPVDVQRHVIVGAQALLARWGYYRSGIDGEFGPGTAAAVRAFQLRMGLPSDGRLNMETLAALGLLPGQRGPRMLPYRRRPLPAPIYRGQWVPG